MWESGDRHYFWLADRQAYTCVQAYWLDLNYAQQKKTNLKRKQKPKKEGDYIEGAEGNVFVMRQTFKNEQSAKRAAAAKWSKLQRGVAEFNITLAEGRADLYPEMPVTVIGFKPTIDSHHWVISRVVHQIDGHGFITSLELEIRIKDVGIDDG